MKFNNCPICNKFLIPNDMICFSESHYFSQGNEITFIYSQGDETTFIYIPRYDIKISDNTICVMNYTGQILNMPEDKIDFSSGIRNITESLDRLFILL